MGRMHNKHSFSEVEIRKLLTHAFRSHQIDHTTGTIRKEHLRNILRTKLGDRELHILDVDRLGHTLRDHGYLLNMPREERRFKFNVKKLELLVMEEERNAHTQKELVQNSEDPATFEYKQTIKRPKKYDLNKYISMNVPVCAVCCKALFVAGSEHIRTVHGEDYEFPDIETNLRTRQMFQLEYTVDATSLLLKVKNMSYQGLVMNQIQLIYDFDKIALLEFNWPYTMSLGETIDIAVNRHYFDAIDYKYSFILHAERVKEFVEQHHLFIKIPLPEVVNVKRAMLKQNTSLSAVNAYHLKRKREDLPLHLSDKSVLNLFTEDFQLKENNPSLMKSEAFKTLIQLKNSNYELTPSNYVSSLKLLNEIEDLYTMIQFDRYYMLDKYVTRKYKNLAIDISDETNVPSLEPGDVLLLRDMAYRNVDVPRYKECNIIKVLDNHIFFKPSDRIHAPNKYTKYEISFRKDRTVIRMGQQALDTLDEDIMSKSLFPTEHSQPSEKYVCYEWFSENVKSNNEQQQAVRNIVNGSAYPAPYLIFGPPGTGKTSTLVEAIAQIWKQKQKHHILVTSGSNYACDEIAARLLKYIPSDDMYRYYSRSCLKKIDDLEDELILISNLTMGFHEHPHIVQLYHYRIVITTLTNAGRLALNHMKKNFFDYIFIDEAGSSTEATAIIPLAGLTSHDISGRTNVVIAGDPKQLGPIIHCKYAEIFGLGRSLLERLMDMDLYKPDPITKLYNEVVITKLLNNYRSHPDILHVANNLFYDCELIAKASPNITDVALGWDLLPNPKVPVIFHCVEGVTKQQDNTHSLYNEKEVTYVVHYVRKIIKEGINGRGIKQSEIGVISPYRKQCQDIKEKFRCYSWKDIEVGSVEQFQGQEKTVIILSTVRSMTNTIGFLDNPKRLNVSITRAKSLLIIIGNPYTLQLNHNWYELLKFCKEKSACQGYDFKLKEPSANLIDATGKEILNYEQRLSLAFNNLIDKFEQMKAN